MSVRMKKFKQNAAKWSKNNCGLHQTYTGVYDVRKKNIRKTSGIAGISSHNVVQRKSFVVLQTSQPTALRLSGKERTCKVFLTSLSYVVFVFRDHRTLSSLGKIGTAHTLTLQQQGIEFIFIFTTFYNPIIQVSRSRANVEHASGSVSGPRMT